MKTHLEVYGWSPVAISTIEMPKLQMSLFAPYSEDKIFVSRLFRNKGI